MSCSQDVDNLHSGRECNRKGDGELGSKVHGECQTSFGDSNKSILAHGLNLREIKSETVLGARKLQVPPLGMCHVLASWKVLPLCPLHN